MTKRSFPLVSLLVYALVLFKVMVLKDIPTIHIGHMMFRFGGTQAGSHNFIPFRTISLYMRGGGGWLIAGLNLFGNIGLLMPVGFLLPFVFPDLSWKKALVWAVASGLAIEGVQVLLQVGIFDIDDVILNGLGVMMGFGLQVIFVKLFRTTTSRTLALVIAALIMILSAYLVANAMQGGREPVRPHHDMNDATGRNR